LALDKPISRKKKKKKKKKKDTQTHRDRDRHTKDKFLSVSSLIQQFERPPHTSLLVERYYYLLLRYYFQKRAYPRIPKSRSDFF